VMKHGVAIAALAVMTAAMGGHAHAQIDPVPSTINYQGTLHDVRVGIQEVGPKNLRIRAYAAKDAAVADAIWGELHRDVALFEGVFNVVLGAGEVISGVPHPPLEDVFTGASIWIGVKVGGETEERQERQQFGSAPYAFTANAAVTAVHGVPAGMIAPWCDAAAAVPEGWLPCDGRVLDATAESGKYDALWQAIGTTWGGTDETAFNVPNLGGRALMGETPGGGALSEHVLGNLLGEERHVLTIQEMPSHTHTHEDHHFGGTYKNTDLNTGWDLDDVIQYVSPQRSTRKTFDASDNLIHNESATTAASHQNMQPSVVVNFIIKY